MLTLGNYQKSSVHQYVPLRRPDTENSLLVQTHFQGARLSPCMQDIPKDCVLAGAWDVDKHFRDTPFEQNIPVQLGLSSIWNVSFLGYGARAILPYTQALSKLAPHIQQVCTLLVC